MRRARAFLVLFACLLTLAAAACGGEMIPPAPGPAHHSPTATATPEPTPTATPTPGATVTPSPTPVPSPTPSPTATATSTPAPTPEPEPTPPPTPEPPAIDDTALTLGEPRQLPAGAALYFGAFPKEGCATDVTRAVFDGEAGAFVTDRPWAFFDEGPGYVTAFNISDDGRTMAAAVCEQGQCQDCYSGPSEDASLHLRVSHNAGADWGDWGEIPQGAYISAVTAEDVAITARLPDPDGESDWDRISRLWWHRSDEDIESPGGLDRGSLRDWRWRAGRFTWEYRGAVPVDDSGDLLPSPWDSDGLLEKGGGWYLDEVRRGGPSLWAFREENSQYFALIGAAGEVGAAFSWDDEPGRLFPSGFLTADLLVGELGVRGYGTVPPTTVLIDLASGSVHPVAGVEEAGIDGCLCLWFVRPAPD